MTKSFKKVIRRLKASHSLKMMHIELYVFKHCYFGHRYTCIWSWVTREYTWPLSWHMLTYGDNSWVNTWYNWILGLQTDDCSQSKKNNPAFKEKVSAKDTKIEGKTGDLYQNTSWLCCRIYFPLLWLFVIEKRKEKRNLGPTINLLSNLSTYKTI